MRERANKYLLVFLISLLLPLQIYAQVNSGQLIQANNFNNSTFQVGDLKHSLLSESVFQATHGDCWVRMRGQDITGSDFSNLMGVNTLPDSSGRFLRDAGGNAEELGEIQGDAIRNITGSFNSRGLQESDKQADGGFAIGSSFPARTTSQQYTGSNQSTGWNFDASRVVPTASENRPVNLTVNYFIKINNLCN